jgi:hypothetical protein
MHMITCPERDHLERQISVAVHELADQSRAAAAVADGEETVGDRKFAELRRQHDILTERRTVLRDCLRLHKDWHGC